MCVCALGSFLLMRSAFLTRLSSFSCSSVLRLYVANSAGSLRIQRSSSFWSRGQSCRITTTSSAYLLGAHFYLPSAGFGASQAKSWAAKPPLPPHSLNDLFAVENGVFVLIGVSLRAGGETDNRFEGHERRESAFFEKLELGEAEDSLQRERRGSSRISKSCL